MRTIGLSGFAGSGKTAAALYLEEKYGFTRRHIAEPLRRMLASLMRDNGISDERIERYLTGDLKDGVIIPELGVTSRHLQITIGTEWGRQQVGDDLWVKTWHRGIKPGEKVMNDSVRFPNEERAIQNDDGITILITRPGTGPASFKWGRFGKWLYRWTGMLWGVHDSERVDRLYPTVVIENNGTLEDLYRSIDLEMWLYSQPKKKVLPDGWQEVMGRWGWSEDRIREVKPDDMREYVKFVREINEREKTKPSTSARPQDVAALAIIGAAFAR